MTYEEVLRNREILFQEYLDYYMELAKEDPRYRKTYEKLKAGKAEFMGGKPAIQVITGKGGMYE